MTSSPDGRRGSRSGPSGVSATGVSATVAVLAAANVLNNRWLTKAYVPSSVASALILLAHSRRRGASWPELGLSRHTVRRGLSWAAGSVAAVGSVYAAALALPATRRAFDDRRAEAGLARAAAQAVGPVLFGTVLLEEIGFRGVLWGLLRRRYGVAAATAVSSVLFGAWHILPSHDLAKHNRAVGEALGGKHPAVAVLGSVAFTAAAGVVLAELRRRSGSLIAPAGLHWATNGLGYLAAAAAAAGRSGAARSL